MYFELRRFLCFFFQAEDGIRDYKVTGVQTCALPIYDGATGNGVEIGLGCEDTGEVGYIPPRECRARAHEISLGVEHPGARSEERRVGKECRGRRAGGRGKTKRMTRAARARGDTATAR